MLAHACMHVCKYVCISGMSESLCACVCRHMCIYVSVCVPWCTPIHLCMYGHVSVWVCLCPLAYKSTLCMCAHVCPLGWPNSFMCAFVHACEVVCKQGRSHLVSPNSFVHVCTCMHTCIPLCLSPAVELLHKGGFVEPPTTVKLPPREWFWKIPPGKITYFSEATPDVSQSLCAWDFMCRPNIWRTLVFHLYDVFIE